MRREQDTAFLGEAVVDLPPLVELPSPEIFFSKFERKNYLNLTSALKDEAWKVVQEFNVAIDMADAKKQARLTLIVVSLLNYLRQFCDSFSMLHPKVIALATEEDPAAREKLMKMVATMARAGSKSILVGEEGGGGIEEVVEEVCQGDDKEEGADDSDGAMHIDADEDEDEDAKIMRELEKKMGNEFEEHHFAFVNDIKNAQLKMQEVNPYTRTGTDIAGLSGTTSPVIKTRSAAAAAAASATASATTSATTSMTKDETMTEAVPTTMTKDERKDAKAVKKIMGSKYSGFFESLMQPSSKLTVLVSETKKMLKRTAPETGNDKVLIFTSFRGMMDQASNLLIKEGIPNYKFDGRLTMAERDAVIRNFTDPKNTEVRVLFLTFKIGGLGLNLTRASNVIICDPWWHAEDEKQAIARAHRFGQTEEVRVVKLYVKNSVEEKIIELQNAKSIEKDNLLNGLTEQQAANMLKTKPKVTLAEIHALFNAAYDKLLAEDEEEEKREREKDKERMRITGGGKDLAEQFKTSSNKRKRDEDDEEEDEEDEDEESESSGGEESSDDDDEKDESDDDEDDEPVRKRSKRCSEK